MFEWFKKKEEPKQYIGPAISDKAWDYVSKRMSSLETKIIENACDEAWKDKRHATLNDALKEIEKMGISDALGIKKKEKSYLCEYCGKSDVVFVEDNYPYSNEHWGCPKCDSTYVMWSYPKEIE